MEVISGLDFSLKNSAVSLGKFDGIHLGHRFLLSHLMQQKQYIPTVCTFEMNPLASQIYTQEEKNLILEKLGVSREIIFPFQKELKNMLPGQFISEILVKRMDAKYICVGKDFRFGKDRQGGIHTLKAYQKQYGYQLETVDKLTCQQKIISSTRIRSLLRQGNLPEANHLLGEPYFVKGTVKHGKEIGRTIKMPTANLVLERGKEMLPFGVYATTVLLEGRRYFGVTNIGRKPTVGECDAGIETHIMDFTGNLYGKPLQIFFHVFLRTERKFENMETMQEQLTADKKQAYQLLTRIDSTNSLQYNE